MNHVLLALSPFLGLGQLPACLHEEVSLYLQLVAALLTMPWVC